MKKLLIVPITAFVVGALLFTVNSNGRANSSLRVQNVAALSEQDSVEAPMADAGCSPTSQNRCVLTFTSGLIIVGTGQPYYNQ